MFWSKRKNTSLVMVLASAWCFVMVVLGGLVMLEPRLGGVGVSEAGATRWRMILGGLLVAGGMSGFAVVAGRLFPKARLSVTSACEVIPWVALVAALAGGVLW